VIYLFALLKCASLYSWAKVKLTHTEEFINHAVCSHTKAKHPNCTKMFVDWPVLDKGGNHIARNVRVFGQKVEIGASSSVSLVNQSQGRWRCVVLFSLQALQFSCLGMKS